jgi:uncharacterized protein (UPF0548 family)
MFFLRRPSSLTIDRVIADSKDLPLSYGPVGLVSGPPRGFDIDDTREVIGNGKVDFERARAALVDWKQFEVGWAELFPKRAPIEPGTAVALLVHHLGFWSLNGCRVVYRVGEADSDHRFGFAYGTVSNHSEMGEEIFEVILDSTSGDVRYEIHAASRPRAPLARLGYPIARVLQARFRRDSVAAMRRAVRGG